MSGGGVTLFFLSWFSVPPLSVLRATDTDLLQESMNFLLSSLGRMLSNLKGLMSGLRLVPVVTKYWQNQ